MILLSILVYSTIAIFHLLLYVMIYGYPDKNDDLSLDIMWYLVTFWPMVWIMFVYGFIFHTKLMLGLLKRDK